MSGIEKFESELRDALIEEPDENLFGYQNGDLGLPSEVKERIVMIALDVLKSLVGEEF